MTLNEFIAYCNSKPGTSETYPFGDHAVWFKIGGKAFAWTFVKPFKFEEGVADPFTFINLKCEPSLAEELRQGYPAVIPGWHQNKKYWNSVFMDGTLTDQKIKFWIDHSYETVLSGLPKREQEAIVY